MEKDERGVEIRRFYYKDDIDFGIRLMGCGCRGDGERRELPVPDCDWRIVLRTSSAYSSYTIGRRGDVLTNCFIEPDTGRIHAVLNGHGLPPGRLKMEMQVECPDGKYPDGFRQSGVMELLPVELTENPMDGCGCRVDGVAIDVTVPYIYADAYDLAVKAGYEGTLEEYTAYVNRFPAVVETSEAVMRLLGDFDEGKGRIARALTAQGCPTEASEPMARMAEKIMDLRLAVDGQPGIVDHSWGVPEGTRVDLLNFMRQHQRADYPYCCGVSTVAKSVPLTGADAYLCDDGTFIENGVESYMFLNELI